MPRPRLMTAETSRSGHLSHPCETCRTGQCGHVQGSRRWVDRTHKPARKHGDSGSQMKNAAVLLHQHGASLATKRVAEITPNDVQAALKDLWERAPMQGRRALNMWGRVFDFAN